MATSIYLCTTLFVLFITVINESAGSPSKKRYLLYNPADLSTLLGYQNHQVHNLASLVDEASANAHGTSGSLSTGPYNVPNFPAMGNNQIQPQTGSAGTSMTGSGSSASGGSTNTGSSSSGGSASFHGTNHWRCDSHVVDKCDTQCLDVDPKDGCPFCVPGCHAVIQTNSGSSTSSSSSGSQSGNSVQSPFAINGQSAGSVQGSGTPTTGTSQSGNLAQNPGKLTGGTSQSGSLSQQPGTLTGSGSQSNGGIGGNLVQLTSGLAGTGGNAQAGKTMTSAPSVQTTGASTGGATSGVLCPHYPPNCPRTYTMIDKTGCLVCTLLAQNSVTKPTVTMTSSTTQPPAVRTCAPKRCVPPCNIGIVIDANGCPGCKCPSHV